MPLEFSYLSEVFPEMSYTGRLNNFFLPEHFIQEEINNKNIEDLPPSYENENKIATIKLNEKLRIDKNGDLQIDTRRFQFISRKLSGDNRWKILEKLKELPNNNVINILITSTYSKDKKWVEEAKKLTLPSKDEKLQ